MIIIGKNTDFVVEFSPQKQCYTVYYKGRLLIMEKYKFADIQSYLN